MLRVGSSFRGFELPGVDCKFISGILGVRLTWLDSNTFLSVEAKCFRNKNALVVKVLESSGINKDDVNCGNTHFKCRYDHRICHSRVKMNSTNWTAPNMRVLVANLIEHCRANAETIGSNPAEEKKFFYRVNLQLYLRLKKVAVDVFPNRLPGLLYPFIC